MKNIFYIIIITVIIIFACLNAPIISSGCSQGISLWYNSIVPVLLPFMLLTGVILNTIDFKSISPHLACLIALIIGLLCGFPTGTLVISFLYQNKLLNRHFAQAMLPVCNNVSPMFLYGYIYSSYLYKYISFYRLLICLYIPQFACTIIILLMPQIKSVFSSLLLRRHIRQLAKNETAVTTENEAAASEYNAAASEYNVATSEYNFAASEYNAAASEYKTAATKNSAANTHSGALFSTAAHNITLIGIFMVVFSILSGIITHYFPFHVTYIATSFLEISSGIDTLSAIPVTDKIKTALFLSLTAFGGLSALFQSYDPIQKSGLSFLKYISVKCLYGILCAVAFLLL